MSTKRRSAKRPAGKDPLLSRYRAALREDRAAQSDFEAFIRVKIARPAVRPKDVAPHAIRKAVREAMREYVEKHAKALGRP